jgi:hypothetical protein
METPTKLSTGVTENENMQMSRKNTQLLI